MTRIQMDDARVFTVREAPEVVMGMIAQSPTFVFLTKEDGLPIYINVDRIVSLESDEVVGHLVEGDSDE